MYIPHVDRYCEHELVQQRVSGGILKREKHTNAVGANDSYFRSDLVEHSHRISAGDALGKRLHLRQWSRERVYECDPIAVADELRDCDGRLERSIDAERDNDGNRDCTHDCDQRDDGERNGVEHGNTNGYHNDEHHRDNCCNLFEHSLRSSERVERGKRVERSERNARRDGERGRNSHCAGVTDESRHDVAARDRARLPLSPPLVHCATELNADPGRRDG